MTTFSPTVTQVTSAVNQAAQNAANKSGIAYSTGTDKTSNSITSAAGRLADNEQTFLSLLTVQLKNQDPLSPLDTNQFTAQLTQMTGVEQQLVSNQLLTQLVGQNQSTLSYGALAAIGKQITATAATAGDPDITGTVTGIQTVNGVTMLNLGDGTSVPLSSVTAVKNPTAT